MKKLIFISYLFLFSGCIFTYDAARGLLHVHNNSNEAIYVYLQYGNIDTLPLFSGLELFTFIDVNIEDTYTIGGSRKNPRLPNNENEVTLFYITEKTIHNYDLEEIHKNQKFAKKTTFTNDDLQRMNWTVIYPSEE